MVRSASNCFPPKKWIGDCLAYVVTWKDGIDACVFTSYYNLYYFSDFLYCSMGRQYAMIVTDEKAVTITPSVDYGYPWRRTTCDNISYTNWHKDNFYLAIQQQVPNRYFHS